MDHEKMPCEEMIVLSEARKVSMDFHWKFLPEELKNPDPTLKRVGHVMRLLIARVEQLEQEKVS